MRRMMNLTITEDILNLSRSEEDEVIHGLASQLESIPYTLRCNKTQKEKYHEALVIVAVGMFEGAKINLQQNGKENELNYN